MGQRREVRLQVRCVDPLHRLSNLPVDADTAGSVQLAVQRLAHERVVELINAAVGAAALPNNEGSERLVQQVQQSPLLLTIDGEEQIEGKTAGHSGC